MDWIAAALNEPVVADSYYPDTNSKQGEDLTPPNFDQFIHCQQQQQQCGPGPQRRPSVLADTINNKQVHFDPTLSAAANSNKSRRPSGGPNPFELNSNVRYHTAFLSGLMQSQGNQPAMSNSGLPQDNKSLGHGGMIQMKGNLGMPPFNKGNSSGGSSHAQAQQQMQMQPTPLSRGSSGAISNSTARTSTPGNNQSGSTNNPTTSSSGGGNSNRQKNDKAVEVHHDHKVIARFRTQTECARYLRATPEAVSYHCSKGGGICNSLVIRPLQGLDVQCDGEGFFGLFEGATEHRPSQRPQLKPETVAILKEWLLSPEHMDNPYPNQKESEMLMQMTGLDKTQLKHWFNNARKRILKPLMKNGGRGMRGIAMLAKKTSPAKKRGARSPSPPGVSNSVKKRKSDGGGAPASKVAASRGSSQGANGSPSLPNDPSLYGNISAALSLSTHKMSSNLTNPTQAGLGQQQTMHQQQARQLFEERFQQDQQQQGREPFNQSNSVSSHGSQNTGNNMMMHRNGSQGMNNMTPNQYEQLMGFNRGTMAQGMMSGGGQGSMGMGYGDSMGGMMNSMGRDSMGMMDSRMMNPRDMMNSRNRQMDPMGLGSGELMYGRGSRGGTGMGGGAQGFRGGMGVGGNDSMRSSFNDNPPSRGNSTSPNIGPRGRQGLQDNFNSDGLFCQPLSNQNQAPSTPPDESARSNAVFKQQVATMAMNEASTAFKDMEDAFAHAKEVLAQARSSGSQHPEEHPRVLEVNAHAKKCQSVAMFKLKVSQRASEEAATAYDTYQRMVEGGGPSDIGGGGLGGGRSSMGGNDSF